MLLFLTRDTGAAQNASAPEAAAHAQAAADFQNLSTLARSLAVKGGGPEWNKTAEILVCGMLFLLVLGFR